VRRIEAQDSLYQAVVAGGSKPGPTASFYGGKGRLLGQHDAAPFYCGQSAVPTRWRYSTYTGLGPAVMGSRLTAIDSPQGLQGARRWYGRS